MTENDLDFLDNSLANHKSVGIFSQVFFERGIGYKLKTILDP